MRPTRMAAGVAAILLRRRAAPRPARAQPRRLAPSRRRRREHEILGARPDYAGQRRIPAHRVAPAGGRSGDAGRAIPKLVVPRQLPRDAAQGRRPALRLERASAWPRRSTRRPAGPCGRRRSTPTTWRAPGPAATSPTGRGAGGARVFNVRGRYLHAARRAQRQASSTASVIGGTRRSHRRPRRQDHQLPLGRARPARGRRRRRHRRPGLDRQRQPDRPPARRRPRLRRAHRRGCAGPSTSCRATASPASRPGNASRGRTPAAPRRGA